MTNTIRTTSLGAFNTCAYKWKYGEINIPIEIAALGDMIHFISRHPQSKDAMVNWYSSQINKDLKLKRIINKLADKVIQYRQNIDNQFDNVYTEVPFVKKIENTWITGTADLVAIKDDELLIIDWKTSNNKNWYEGDNIWNESLQSAIYSYMAMVYFGFEKAKFRYVVLEKTSTASLTEFEREFTKDECFKKIKQVVLDYEYAIASEDYEAKENRMCYFCELKNECPLYKVKDNLESELLF